MKAQNDLQAMLIAYQNGGLHRQMKAYGWLLCVKGERWMSALTATHRHNAACIVENDVKAIRTKILRYGRARFDPAYMVIPGGEGDGISNGRSGFGTKITGRGVASASIGLA